MPLTVPLSLALGRYKQFARRGGEDWQGGLVRLQVWIDHPTDPDGESYRPTGALSVSLRTGLIHVDLPEEGATSEFALAALLEFGRHEVPAANSDNESSAQYSPITTEPSAEARHASLCTLEMPAGARPSGWNVAEFCAADPVDSVKTNARTASVPHRGAWFHKSSFQTTQTIPPVAAPPSGSGNTRACGSRARSRGFRQGSMRRP